LWKKPPPKVPQFGVPLQLWGVVKKKKKEKKKELVAVGGFVSCN